jgi:CHAT domain-containing protein/predicted RNase H-like HicB family nuclease
MKKILYPIIILIAASIAILCYADDSDKHRSEVAQLQIQSDSLYAIGVDLYHAGRYSEAISFFTESDKIDKAILASTSNRCDYSAMWLASCYYKLNDTAKAAQLDSKYYMIKPVDRRLTKQADSLYLLGMEFYTNFDIENAVRSYTECADILKQQLGECPMYATALNDLSICYSSLANYEEAIRLSTQALHIREQILGKEHPDYALSLSNLATFQSGSGNYSEAIHLGTEALLIQEKVLGKDNLYYATSLNNLADNNSYIGNYSEAIRLGSEAVNIREKILGKEDPEYAMSLSNLAGYYSQLGDYSEAIRLGTDALNIIEPVLGKENTYFLIFLNNLSLYTFETGNFREAIRLGTEVIHIANKVVGKDHPYYATTLDNLAGYYSSLGDDAEAIRLCAEALHIRETILGKEHPDYARTLNNIAMYHSNLGNYESAARLETEALNIQEQILGTEHPDYATSLSNLALYYANLGNYSNAIHLGTEALRITEHIVGKGHIEYAISLSNLATYNYYMGNYGEAIKLGTEALMITEDVVGKEHPDYAAALCNLANYNSTIDNYEEAIDLIKEAINIQVKVLGEKHPKYATSLNNLAHYYSKLENYCDAINLTTDALKINEQVFGKEHPSYAIDLSNLSTYNMKLGNYCEAIRLGTDALNIQKRALGNEHPSYLEIAFNLSEAYIAYNKITEGVKYLTEYCERVKALVCRNFCDLTSSERSFYWDKYKYVFWTKVPSLSYQHSSRDLVNNAYSGLLFGKGLLLNAETELRKNILESGDEVAINAINELKINRLMLNKQLEKPISERTLSTDSLNTVISSLEHKLMTLSKEYGDYTKNLRIDTRDVQAKLTKGDIAVEFASFEMNDTTIYCAYLLKSEYKSPKMKVCLKQTDRTMFAYAYSNPELSKALWGSIADELQDVDNIYFAPSGELYNVAIESLPDWENPSKLVSDRWKFYRLSSTRELALIKDKNQIKQSVVYGGLKYDTDTATIVRDSKQYRSLSSTTFSSAIADSLHLRDGVADLPGTKIEANAIDTKLRAVKIEDIVRTDTIGTEASFKALSGQKKNLLHIATHGFYWSENEAKTIENLNFLLENDEMRIQEDKALTRSGLLFAGANNALKGQPLPEGVDDGILTAQEISQLDLRGLDLVVLSACETGLGEITGDGVFGLQRGFKKAGAQSIMMSLWKVDDNATQMLMTQFYANLTSGKSKRQSLLDAQRYIREYEDPSAPDGPKRHPYSDPRYWAAFILLDAID